MAELSNSEYKQQTDALFPSNTRGGITAEKLRTHFDNTADSVPFKISNRSTAPTAADDVAGNGGNGEFTVGDFWVDETNDLAYIAIDVTANAAIWQLLGSSNALNGIVTQDDGVEVDPAATTLNFTGGGVTATDAGGNVTEINIPSAAFTPTYAINPLQTITVDSSTGTPTAEPFDTVENALAWAEAEYTSAYLIVLRLIQGGTYFLTQDYTLPVNWDGIVFASSADGSEIDFAGNTIITNFSQAISFVFMQVDNVRTLDMYKGSLIGVVMGIQDGGFFKVFGSESGESGNGDFLVTSAQITITKNNSNSTPGFLFRGQMAIEFAGSNLLAYTTTGGGTMPSDFVVVENGAHLTFNSSASVGLLNLNPDFDSDITVRNGGSVSVDPSATFSGDTNVVVEETGIPTRQQLVQAIDDETGSTVWRDAPGAPVNARSIDYLYLEVNSGGTANPADPEGGDAFDTIANCFAWVENNYSGVNQLDVQLQAEVYASPGSSMVIPNNLGVLTFYGAARATTTLNNGAPSGTRYQQVYFQNMTVNCNFGYTSVGGLYLFDVEYNTSSEMSIGGAGDHYYGTLGSRLQNCDINITGSFGTPRNPLTFSGSGVQIDTGVSISVTNTTTNNGTNGGNVLTIAGGPAVLENGTVEIEDESSSVAVDGTIRVYRGGSIYVDPTATLTTGIIDRQDGAVPNVDDLTAEIEDITGTSYTVLTSDVTKYKQTTNAAAVTITVDGTSGFQRGDEIFIEQNGTGVITFAEAGGMSIQSRGDLLSTAGRYATCFLKFKSATECTLSGDLA